MSDKERKQAIFLGIILAVALPVLLWKYGVFGGGAETTAPPAAETSTMAMAEGFEEGAAEQIDIEALIAGIQEVTFDYELERRAVNPMRPLVGMYQSPLLGSIGTGEGVDGATAAPDYVLLEKAQRMEVSGIIWDSSFPVAVIDGEVLQVSGEVSPGIRIHSITQDTVELEVGDDNTIIPKALPEGLQSQEF